jgi:hypothetical protein
MLTLMERLQAISEIEVTGAPRIDTACIPGVG